MLALALVMALLSALLVLEPLLRTASGRAITVPAPLFSDSDDEDDPRLIRRDRALAALKEIEFDRATGKLSDDDYESMKTRFTAEALTALREAAAAADAPASRDDAVEQLIASARRRGASRRFCLECGASLEGKGKFCLECGTPVASPASS
jgi:hypothetical protein